MGTNEARAPLGRGESPEAMTQAAVAGPAHLVPIPRSIRDTGLSQQFLAELVLKVIYHAGRTTGHDISNVLQLPFPIVHEVLLYLKAEEQVEVAGSQGLGEQSYEYVLPDRGRDKAIEAIGRTPYYGPAPVTVEQYITVMAKQQAERPAIDRQTIERLTQELVLSEEMIPMLGPALNSGEPIFLFGPTGNGKTSLALAMGKAVAGTEPVFVPYVVEIDGQLIKVFDPVVHVEAREERAGIFHLFPGLDSKPLYDRRWVQIQRPMIVVGGELTLNKLDPYFEPVANLYHAPLQMKANGGTLVIDDFGRQQMRPADLLNRWIIPLERHSDNISLATGQTFEVPLQLVLVFATNLEPNELLDEAYMRRLPYKVPVENPTPEQYRLIFKRVCDRSALPYDGEVVDFLLASWYGEEGLPMRASHPSAIVAHVLQICRFEERPPRLTNQLIDRACALYFAGYPHSNGSVPKVQRSR